jgi:hypothetical protein
VEQRSAKELLTERFRCPEFIAPLTTATDLFSRSGYFRFGRDAICYGQCSSGVPAKFVTDDLYDASEKVRTNASAVELPFDPFQIVDNLRFERYAANSREGHDKLLTKNAVRNLYYLVRPFMPVAIRKQFQRVYFRGWENVPFPSWPVDRTVDNIFEQLLACAMRARNVERLPFVWFWPDGAPSCAILTHDVETSAGAEFCPQLMDLNDSFGIKASFQIVPEERYSVPPSFLENIRKRGFEVNVHDLNHDGHLFNNRAEYLRRAERIRHYARKFGALGFRSAVLYRNVDWFDALDFFYDMSIPNVAHLDPQRGGCCTVFPFLIGTIIELPVTATQDYSLFHILGDYSIRLWQKQIALIRAKHGLMSFIIHPDYIIPERARRVYSELLLHLSELRSQEETWIALPKEVAAWWRMRSEMSLVKEGGSWRIEGKGSERARIAYAVLVDDRVVYEINQTS